MADFNGQAQEREPRSVAEAIAQVRARSERERREKAQAAAWEAEERQRQQALAAAKHMQPWGMSQRGFLRALAKGIVPWIKEVLQPLEERLAKLEAATGLSKTAKQPGVEAISPVIKNYIDARLRPVEALVHELDGDAMRYSGVWRAKTYKRGQTVSHAGGQWFALEATDSKPGSDGSWKLTVKSGRAPGTRDADEN